MKSLYITSVVTFSGKTALSLGLGLHMRSKDLSVGYVKPVSLHGYRAGSTVTDEDADFVRRVLQLDQSVDEIAPIIVNDQLLNDLMAGKLQRDFWAEVESAYARAGEGKDIVLLEGGASMRDGFALGLNTVSVVRRLNTPTLTVTRWRDSGNLLDDIFSAKQRIQDLLLGAVINNVPENMWEYVKNTIVPYLEKEGVPVFGVLPHQRELTAISVGEIADLLDAKVLAGDNLRSRLVENLVVGAMTVESALPRFRRTVNKAVITGGDRTDLQAAALETSTVCLVLSGNLQPSATIVKRAEEMGVGILLVADSTIEAVEKVEKVMGKTRLGQAEKLNRFQAMLAEHLDYDRLMSSLELA